MKHTAYWARKLYRRIVQLVGSRFYINPDPDIANSILVAGAARSGTTWLGDLIASQIRCRILFEPFNPDLVPQYRGFQYFQYMQPGADNPEFRAFAREVFTGEIQNRWIDRQNERVFSEYRLVKEIRANLALKWLHDSFPEIPIVFLIRHPCAVVASRIELGWATDRDIEPFLSQPALIADHLAPYMDLIKNARTAEEKHAIIWSVSNLVPLKQFKPNEIKIVYYENLCTQSEMELPAIFGSIGQTYEQAANEIINRPSQTTHVTSAIVNDTDKVSSWMKKLNVTQIENVLRIVDAFGLGYVYGESLLPLSQNAK